MSGSSHYSTLFTVGSRIHPGLGCLALMRSAIMCVALDDVIPQTCPDL